MGFAEAWATVEEERVVAVAWGINDAASGGDGEVIVGTNDEVIEGVFVIEAGFVVAGLFGGGGALDGAKVLLKGKVTSGDFARANFGFDFGLDLKVDGFDFEIGVLECGGDDGEVAVAELFDVERILDTNDNIAVITRDDGCALEPSREIGWGNLLLDFS